MSIVNNVEKIVANARVVVGQTVSGANKYQNVSLGAMSTTTFDDAKAYAVAGALEPCLQYPIGYLQKIITSTIEDE